MAKFKRRFMITLITILFSMVFAVNLGFTFALPDFEKNVASVADGAGSEEFYTYLNDVVVNNSTTASPIAFTKGTVEREINFDYSFSEDTDVAIKYNLKYTSGEDATNVKLNIVNRDDYILDTSLIKGYYDGLASSGTLYYLPTISAGTGNQKVISSVTFYDDNNEISSYYATQSVTLKQINYTTSTVYTAEEFEYTHLDIERYWQINSYISNGNTISVAEYNALSPSEKQAYSINDYKAIEGYTISTGTSGYTSVSANAVVSASNYENYLKAGDNNWKTSYICVTEFDSYSLGQEISSSSYNALSNENKTKFIPQYSCITAYTVTGANTSTITSGREITAEEYNNLFILEQRYFLPKSYTSYENKKLVIEMEVFTKLSASGASDEASTYYTTDHYFKNLKHSQDSTAFDRWVSYKSNQAVSQDTIMFFNAHADFDRGIAYNYDFNYGTDIKSTEYNSDIITTAYTYIKNGSETPKFYSRAGGNQSYAGVGVYYMTTSNKSIKFTVGANWYDPRGKLLNSMPVSNINLKVNSNASELNGVYTYNMTLPAGSYGYIDLLDYIEITTRGNIFNLDGCRVVITSINAEFVSATGSLLTKTEVYAENSTSSSASLYKFGSMGSTNTIDARISIKNDSENPVKPTITLTPKFVAYNGQSGSLYGIAKTKYIEFDGTNNKFNYNSNIWNVVPSSSNGEYHYTFSMKTNYYIAPNSSINLIEGVEIADHNADGWDIGTSGTSLLYADYWFSIDTSNVSSSSASLPNSGTISTNEIISDLQFATISRGESSYIAYQNKTSQTLTSVSLTFSLKDATNVNNSISCSVLNYATNSTSSYSNTITIFYSNINLLPGESVIFAKVTSSNTNPIKLTDYSVSATLGSSTEPSTTYFKRDAISGNYSIINPSEESSTLAITITNFAGGTVSDISVNGESYWTKSSNKYSYDSSIRAGQMINIISDYYNQMLKVQLVQVN